MVVTVRHETGVTGVVECQDIAYYSHATKTAYNHWVVPRDRVDRRCSGTVVFRHYQYCHPIRHHFREEEAEDDTIDEVSV
jgi:hypothetical protein